MVQLPPIDDSGFWIARGKAIEAYAQVEQAMFHIFHGLSKSDHNNASAFFYAMQSGRNEYVARIINALERPIVRKWQPLHTKLQEAATIRHAVAHWKAVSGFTYQGNGLPLLDNTRLFPFSWPAHISDKEKALLPIDAARLVKFSTECSVLHKKLMVFASSLWKRRVRRIPARIFPPPRASNASNRPNKTGKNVGTPYS